AHVIVVTDADDTNDLLEFAQERIDALEARWTRFDDRSELTRLNATAGTGPAVVSVDTFLLVQRAVDAWELTHGRFDPTVLPALMAAGYDRDFDELAADGGRGRVDVAHEAGVGRARSPASPPHRPARGRVDRQRVRRGHRARRRRVGRRGAGQGRLPRGACRRRHPRR